MERALARSIVFLGYRGVLFDSPSAQRADQVVNVAFALGGFGGLELRVDAVVVGAATLDVAEDPQGSLPGRGVAETAQRE